MILRASPSGFCSLAVVRPGTGTHLTVHCRPEKSENWEGVGSSDNFTMERNEKPTCLLSFVFDLYNYNKTTRYGRLALLKYHLSAVSFSLEIEVS